MKYEIHRKRCLKCITAIQMAKIFFLPSHIKQCRWKVYLKLLAIIASINNKSTLCQRLQHAQSTHFMDQLMHDSVCSWILRDIFPFQRIYSLQLKISKCKSYVKAYKDFEKKSDHREIIRTFNKKQVQRTTYHFSISYQKGWETLSPCEQGCSSSLWNKDVEGFLTAFPSAGHGNGHCQQQHNTLASLIWYYNNCDFHIPLQQPRPGGSGSPNSLIWCRYLSWAFEEEWALYKDTARNLRHLWIDPRDWFRESTACRI